MTALLAIVLQPVLGVAPLGAAFTSFMSPVFFFVLVMFVIAAGVHEHRAWTGASPAGCWPRRDGVHASRR